VPAFNAAGFAGGARGEVRAAVGGAGFKGDSGVGQAARGGVPETAGGGEEAEGRAATGAWVGSGIAGGNAAADGRRRGCDCAGGAAGWGMVWAAGRLAESADAQQELEVVVRGPGHQAGAGDQGYDDSAAISVLRVAGAGAGQGAGVHVGNHAGGGIRRRKVSCGGVCGVFPVCQARVVEKRWRK